MRIDKPTCFLRLPLLILVLAFFSLQGAAADQSTTSMAEATSLKVYKNPQCGCCSKWVDHMSSAGFSTKTQDQNDLSTLKQDYGIAPQYQSCHTGIANGYVFEGHIPAEQVQRFLAAPPEGAIGLAVPGMPIGSPGMAMGDRVQEYDVLLLKKDGSSEVFAHIRRPGSPDEE